MDALGDDRQGERSPRVIVLCQDDVAGAVVARSLARRGCAAEVARDPAAARKALLRGQVAAVLADLPEGEPARAAQWLRLVAQAGVPAVVLLPAGVREPWPHPAGRRRVLRKPVPWEQVFGEVAALMAAAAGRPGVAAPLPPPGARALSVRERQALELVGRGLSNAEIAGEMGVSVPTIKKHVQRVLAKLGARDRLQAALMAASWRSGGGEKPSRPPER